MNLLHYEYKLGTLTPLVELSLEQDVIRVSTQSSSGKTDERTIPYHEVCRFRELSEVHVVDEQSGSFNVRRCVVFSQRAKALHIGSGYVTGNRGRFQQVARDQSAEFDAFVQSLKERVAAEGGRVVVESGWLAASIAWGAVALLGTGMLAMGLIMPFYETDLLGALLPMLFCLIIGPATAWGGFGAAREYWPRRVTLETHLAEGSDT